MNDLIYKQLKKDYNLIDTDYLAQRVYYFLFNSNLGINEIVEYLNFRRL